MPLAFAKPSHKPLLGNHSLRPYYALLFAFGGFLIVALLVLNAFAPSGRRVAKITGVDGPVYFGIAHSLLFDRDVDLTNEFQHIAPEDRMWTLIQKSTARPGSVYPIGYSLVGMPFLLAGYGVDALLGRGDGGYRRFAVLGFSLTNVFLAGGGLIALFTFLVRAGKSFGIRGPAAHHCVACLPCHLLRNRRGLLHFLSHVPHSYVLLGKRVPGLVVGDSMRNLRASMGRLGHHGRDAFNLAVAGDLLSRRPSLTGSAREAL